MEITKKTRPRKPIIVKKEATSSISIHVDGVSLDRACRRLRKRINMPSLLSSLSQGKEVALARYYTLIPFEDDSRHRSFLDAVERAGFEVVAKRLPPKNVDRQVSVDVEMASDMLNFALSNDTSAENSVTQEPADQNKRFNKPLKKSVLVVCPSYELVYPLQLLGDQGITTTTADFGKGQRGDFLKSAINWVDLSYADGIWL